MVLLNIQVQHFVTALRRLDWIKTLFSLTVFFLSNVTKYFISFHFYKTYLMFATLLNKNSFAKYTVFTLSWSYDNHKIKCIHKALFMYQNQQHSLKLTFLCLHISPNSWQTFLVVSEFQKLLELWFFDKIHILFLC